MVTAAVRRLGFRIYRLLWVDPKPTEISGCMAGLLWGLFMVVNSDAIAERPSYGRILEVMSADLWGIAVMLLGAMQGYALVFDRYRTRRCMAVLMTATWSVLFFLLMSTMNWRVEVWFYLVFAMGGLWTYIQLPVHRGR